MPSPTPLRTLAALLLTMISISQVFGPTRVRSLSLWQGVVLGALTAAALNALLHFIAVRLDVMPPAYMLRNNGETKVIALFDVVRASIVPAIVGGIIYWIMGFIRRPAAAFTVLSAVVTFGSLIPTLSYSEVPMNIKLVLSAMHVIAGAAIWYFIVTRASEKAWN